MRARRFPAANKVYELPGGNEDNSLCDSTLGEMPMIRSMWVPTAEERERIAAGANITLLILGRGQPPVVVEVTDEQPGRV